MSYYLEGSCYLDLQTIGSKRLGKLGTSDKEAWQTTWKRTTSLSTKYLVTQQQTVLKKKVQVPSSALKDIVDHTGIYLNKENNLKLIFLLQEELMEQTFFSIDVYENSGDIYVDDHYLMSIIREGNSGRGIFRFNMTGILSLG